MTETFSKEEFEKVLPRDKSTGTPLWSPLGLMQGEHCYYVGIEGQPQLAIMVRSSVGPDGYAAGCGEDSIRCWLVDRDSGLPQGSKISKWTTRVPGWQRRLLEVLRELWKMGKALTPCPECGSQRFYVKVKKEGPNKGRIFLTCRPPRLHGDHGSWGCRHFEWVT